MPARHVAIGVDLGGTNIRAALVRDDGVILRSLQCRSAWDPATYANLEDNLGVLHDLVHDLVLGSETVGNQPVGIGVGVTGHVNRRGEFIGGKGPREAFAKSVPVLAPLRSMFHLPVWVDNDSKAATWGEYLYGAGRGTNTLIGITLGTGIGGGIVINGRLFHGADGLAGHLGFMTVNMYGPQDVSGVVGHLEQYASGTGIMGASQDALRDGAQSSLRATVGGDVDRVTSEMVFAAQREGDPLAQTVFDNAVRALGLGTASLIHIFNPDVVVIGGGVIQQGEAFLGPVKRTVSAHTLMNFDQTPVRPAVLGPDAGVIGAAALCWQPSAT